jgi:hypothetical protein
MHEPTSSTTNDQGDEVHPAFGNITVHRSSASGGRHGGMILFDSEIPHNELMTVRVTRATRRRNLNNDWIHSDNNTLLEIQMSLAQWASFVSSMNSGGGVPCTIRATETEQNVPGLEFAPRLALSVEETRSAAKKAFAEIKEARDTYEAHKTAANLRALHYAIENATSNIDYATKTLTEHTENVVQKARADVEAMVVQHAKTLGINPSDVRMQSITAAPNSSEETE